MSAARFFTDEDVYGAIAPALRKSGVGAITPSNEMYLPVTVGGRDVFPFASR